MLDAIGQDLIISKPGCATKIGTALTNLRHLKCTGFSIDHALHLIFTL